MSDILIRNIDTLITMDDERRELSGVDLRISGGVVAEIGQGLQADGAETVDARG